MHKLSRIIREAGTYELRQVAKISGSRMDTLTPEADITANDGLDVVLIYAIAAGVKRSAI